MRCLAAVTLLLFALLAAPASGGGFATTGLSSLPDGTAAGEPWVVDVTILGHGRTPAEGMSPSVIISRAGEQRRFDAVEVRPGVYRARVVFPDAGRWRYAVDSGWGLPPERFAPVDIAASAPAASSSSDLPRWPLAIGAGLLAALTVAGTGPLLRRRPRAVPAR
jgi:hypothetical protein